MADYADEVNAAVEKMVTEAPPQTPVEHPPGHSMAIRAIDHADEYLKRARKSDVWKTIDWLRDEVVRSLQRETALQRELDKTKAELERVAKDNSDKGWELDARRAEYHVEPDGWVR